MRFRTIVMRRHPYGTSVTSPSGPGPDSEAGLGNSERVPLSSVASGIGLVALVVGLFELLWAAQGLPAPGTVMDPMSSLRLDLLLKVGALSAFSGGALWIGGFYVPRLAARAGKASASPPRPPGRPGHGTLLALAALLTVGVVVLTVLPTPSRNVAFSPRDFQPLAQPTNLTSYGAYRVSRNFWADHGGVVGAVVQITWTDNRTGAVLFGGTPGTFEVYASSASSPRESPEIAGYFIAPADGFYVLVVWLGRCITPTSDECANTTVAVQAQLRTADPAIYLPAQTGGGILGPGLVAVSAAIARKPSLGGRP